MEEEDESRTRGKRRGEQKPTYSRRELPIGVDMSLYSQFFCIFLQINVQNSQKTVFHCYFCNISVPLHYCPLALCMEREGGERCPFPPFPHCFHPDVLYSSEREKSFLFLPSLPVSTQTQADVLYCTVTVPLYIPLL